MCPIGACNAILEVRGVHAVWVVSRECQQPVCLCMYGRFDNLIYISIFVDLLDFNQKTLCFRK